MTLSRCPSSKGCWGIVQTDFKKKLWELFKVWQRIFLGEGPHLDLYVWNEQRMSKTSTSLWRQTSAWCHGVIVYFPKPKSIPTFSRIWIPLHLHLTEGKSLYISFWQWKHIHVILGSVSFKMMHSFRYFFKNCTPVGLVLHNAPANLFHNLKFIVCQNVKKSD